MRFSPVLRCYRRGNEMGFYQVSSNTAQAPSEKLIWAGSNIRLGSVETEPDRSLCIVEGTRPDINFFCAGTFVHSARSATARTLAVG